MIIEDPERVLVDPSLLLDPSSLDWLVEVADMVVVSSRFRQLVVDDSIAADSPLLPPSSTGMDANTRNRLIDFMQRTWTFSLTSVEPTRRQADVVQSLLQSGSLSDSVDVEQFMYLQSHSIMYSLTRRPLDAFKRGQAVVQEYGSNVLDLALDRVIPSTHRARYSPRQLFVRGGIKWLIVGGGGAAAGAFGSLPGVIAGSGVADILVRAADP